MLVFGAGAVQRGDRSEPWFVTSNEPVGRHSKGGSPCCSPRGSSRSSCSPPSRSARPVAASNTREDRRQVEDGFGDKQGREGAEARDAGRWGCIMEFTADGTSSCAIGMPPELKQKLEADKEAGEVPENSESKQVGKYKLCPATRSSSWTWTSRGESPVGKNNEGDVKFDGDDPHRSAARRQLQRSPG